MTARAIFIWMIGIVLIPCWFGSLYETTYFDGHLRIAIDDNSLFLGFSFLIAAWVVTINLPSRSPVDRLASDYVNFITEISEKALTLEELATGVGETSVYSIQNPGPNKLEPSLSGQQLISLKRLIYEGKICLRDNKSSVPSNPQSV